jgi:hypothetical protein
MASSILAIFGMLVTKLERFCGITHADQNYLKSKLGKQKKQIHVTKVDAGSVSQTAVGNSSEIGASIELQDISTVSAASTSSDDSSKQSLSLETSTAEEMGAQQQFMMSSSIVDEASKNPNSKLKSSSALSDQGGHGELADLSSIAATKMKPDSSSPDDDDSDGDDDNDFFQNITQNHFAELKNRIHQLEKMLMQQQQQTDLRIIGATSFMQSEIRQTQSTLQNSIDQLLANQKSC